MKELQDRKSSLHMLLIQLGEALSFTWTETYMRLNIGKLGELVQLFITVGARIIRTPRLFLCKQVMQNCVLW